MDQINTRFEEIRQRDIPSSVFELGFLLTGSSPKNAEVLALLRDISFHPHELTVERDSVNDDAHGRERLTADGLGEIEGGQNGGQGGLTVDDSSCVVSPLHVKPSVVKALSGHHVR